MQLNPYQAAVAFDDAVWRHGYDSEEAIKAREAAEAVNAKSIEVADAIEAKPRRFHKLYREGLFEKLPRSVARDARLSPAETVILAHHALFIGDFVPNEGLDRQIVKPGLGKDTVRNAIARLRDKESFQARRKRERAGNLVEPELLGYLRRRQNVDRNGEFLKADEELCLPKSRWPCLVPREWFDGRFTVNELAVLLYVQARTEKGGMPYIREIAERFNVSEQVVARALRGLDKKGVVRKHQDRRKGGRFAGARYDLTNRKTVNLHRVKNTGNGATGNGQSGNIRRESLYKLSSRESSNICIRSSYASRQNSEDAETIDHQELLSDAFCSQSLLGWIEDKPIQEDFFSIDEDAIQAISAVAGEKELLDLLRKATGRRVSSEIMSSAGIAAVRQIAAHVLEQPPYGESFEPHEALDYVLSAIRDRIGNKQDAWLNSLAVIGLRILWSGYGGDGVEETPYRSQPPRRMPSASMASELKSLKKADGARVIAPKLYRDLEGFQKLLRKYGPEALDTIKSCLMGAMIDGSAVGKIKTWTYFVGALEDERRAAEFKAQGMRPGDCPGWRQASSTNSDGRAADA